MGFAFVGIEVTGLAFATRLGGFDLGAHIALLPLVARNGTFVYAGRP